MCNESMHSALTMNSYFYIYQMIKSSKVLIPVNVNHLGSHNILAPTDVYVEFPKTYKKQSKPLKIQRCYIDPDINKAQQTPLHPPYQNYPESYDRVQCSVKNHFNNSYVDFNAVAK